MADLTQQHCVPCEGGVPPLQGEREVELHQQIPQWELDRSHPVHKLRRTLTLKNFMACVELVNRIAQLAESEGHHPDLKIHGYKHLTIELYTHAIHGLFDNDFILAAKIDQLLNE